MKLRNGRGGERAGQRTKALLHRYQDAMEHVSESRPKKRHGKIKVRSFILININKQVVQGGFFL